MNIACDFPSDPSYFKLAPLEFDCDFKLAAGAATPPTPSTPTINSKYIDGLNDFEPEEFELNPPTKTKSLSLQSISDKENKHFSSNTPKTPKKPKKRGRGRPKGSKNKKKKSKLKSRTLQLPNLKHIPKTVTQFELRLSPPYYTPPPLTPIPQPSFWEPTYIHSPFQIDSFPSYYQYTRQQSLSPNPLLIDHRNQVYSPPNYNHLPPPTQPIPIRYRELIESPNRGKRAYYNMNTNDDQYNNANHPNKRRKITHSEDIYATYTNHNNHLNVPGAVQQFQSGNMNGSEMNNNNNMSISGAESENEPIISPHKRAINHAIEEEEKHNNITKRALFKEKLSNININANERNMNITPATAPNETNIASNLPNIEQKPGEHTHPHTQAQNSNNLELSNGGHCGNDGAMIMDAVSAPILNNNNSNLDWFGADENINTLNANNHPFEMNMFPMGMGDDMKDMGLPSFMMNDIIPNQPDMMDMDLISNNNTNNGIIHRVKQENNILPPPITNNNYPPTNYHNNLPRFSISSSPPQPSSMFMDQINANSNSNIYAPNEYTYGQNNLIRSRSLQNGPNALRPANLPTLRRSASATASNNSNLGVEYVTSSKTAKSESNKSNASATNAAGAASRSHVLTPFDYPLSNELITSKKGIAHDNDGFNENNAPNSSHFNFLWWYPEVKFCELDPQLIPIP